MPDTFQKYESARARLLDTLRVVAPAPHGTDALGHRDISEAWAASSQNEGIHLKLVSPYRAMPYTFMLAHLEKGTVHQTILPEDVTLQCIAGRYRVTINEQVQLVVAPGSVAIPAGVLVRYEALEEVYNIMSVTAPA
jgi:hypothetical protein